jgi:hypothetical protein
LRRQGFAKDFVGSAFRDLNWSVRIVEWPSGTREAFQLDVEEDLLAALRRGRKNVPIGERMDWRELASLPWGTTLRVRPRDELRYIATGSARYSNGWYLPIIDEVAPSDDAARVKRGAARFPA